MKFAILITILMSSMTHAQLVCVDYFRVPIKSIYEKQFRELGHDSSLVFVSQSGKRLVATFSEEAIQRADPETFRFTINIFELTDSGAEKLHSFKAFHIGSAPNHRRIFSQFHFIKQLDGSEFLVLPLLYQENDINKTSVVVLKLRDNGLTEVAKKTFSASEMFPKHSIKVETLKTQNGDTDILMSDLNTKTMTIFNYADKAFSELSIPQSNQEVLANRNGNQQPFHIRYDNVHLQAYLEVLKSGDWHTVYQSAKGFNTQIQPVKLLDNSQTSYSIESSRYQSSQSKLKLLEIRDPSLQSSDLSLFESRSPFSIQVQSAFLIEKEEVSYLVTYSHNHSMVRGGNPPPVASIHVFKLSGPNPKLHSQLNFPSDILSNFQIFKNSQGDFQIFGTSYDKYILMDLFPY